MKIILLILVFVVSILGAADLVGVDGNDTIQTAIEHFAEDVSIGNNASWNIFLYDSIEFLKVNIYSAIGVSLLLIIIFWYFRLLRSILLIILFNILYIYFKININFPVIDIIYYAYFIWILNRFHKYLVSKKIFDSILHTKVNLLFHIIEIFILILVLVTILNSYEGLSIYIKVIASFAVAGFAFIARGYFKSLLSFVYNSWETRISKNDIINVADFKGKVLAIYKFSIVLEIEEDGKKGKAYIPHYLLDDKGFKNFGKENSYRKIRFKVVSYNNKSNIALFIKELKIKLTSFKDINSDNYIKEINVDKIEVGFYSVKNTDKEIVKNSVLEIIRDLAQSNHIRLES